MDKTLNEQLQDANRKLEILMSNMPGGFMIYEAQSGKFRYLSDGLLSMFGCSEEAFLERYYNSFDMLVYKQDRKRVKDMIDCQLQFMGNVEVNFRIKSMLDEVMYVEYKGRQVIERDGEQLFYAVLTDVTERVIAQNELNRMNEELYIETQRYKLLQEALDDTPFDYDIRKDQFIMVLHNEGRKELTLNRFKENKEYLAFVHEEDVQNLQVALDAARKEATKGTVECRIRYKETDPYCWYRIFYASFQNSNGEIVRMVGNFKDIAAERARQEEMRNKIRLDAMTGILNKTTMQASVQDFLNDAMRDQLHALMMIDTDNFKAINDNLGHLYGDEVIKFVARTIKKTFRESDFVGRVGGDEFMVFMKNTTKEVTEQRAKELNTAIRQTFEKDGITIGISCSIGIAFYPRNGLDYAVLFANADDALYRAKAAGKDRYVICSN